MAIEFRGHDYRLAQAPVEAQVTGPAGAVRTEIAVAGLIQPQIHIEPAPLFTVIRSLTVVPKRIGILEYPSDGGSVRVHRTP
jgi:hypothetical protein